MDDSELPPSHGSSGEPPRRARARWRALTRSALREEQAPPAEELGEEAYWSYLRGNAERSLVEGDAEQRDSRAESGRARSDAPERRRSEAPEASVPPSRAADGSLTWEALPIVEVPPPPPPPPLPPPAATATATATALPIVGVAPPPPPAAMALPIVAPPPPPAATALPIVEVAPLPTALPIIEVAPPPTGAAAAQAETAQPTTTAADPVTGQQPVLDVERPPAWHRLFGSSRRERVLPGIAQPVTLTALMALGWLAVVAYGVFRLDLLWSLGALAAGAVALALALRGRSVVGLAPVLVGAAAWGMATGGQVPASLSDLVGDLRLIGWNALYAVPLLITYGLATWLDAVGSARDRVRAVLGDRRWWGAADLPDAEPRIAALEAVRSARFFQLPSGSCPHLVTAGRQVALIRSTVWPRGAYTVMETGEVRRNGRVFAHGSRDLSGAVTDVRTWAERLDSVTPTVVGFLVVHPASDRPDDKVDIDIPQTGGVRVINAEEFVAVGADFLAVEPYRLDVALTERIGEHLPIFEAQAA